jgi:hypothetical protein
VKNLESCADVLKILPKDDFRVEIRGGATSEVGFEDLARSHDGGSWCGLCLIWALVRQYCRATGANTISREECEIRLGAWGDGIRDAVEFLFGPVDDRRVVLDKSLGGKVDAPDAPDDGSFAFRIVSPGGSGTFVLKEEAVPHEYLRLCEEKNKNPRVFEEEASRKRLQLEFARDLLRRSEPFVMIRN